MINRFLLRNSTSKLLIPSAHFSWQPPFKLRDCSSEYLEDSPVPYSMLRNPYRQKKLKYTPEEEQKIWSLLGALNNLDDKPTSTSSAKTTSASEKSLFYAQSVPALQSMREVKRERRAKKKAALEKWYGLPKGDLTPEVKADLELIAKRQILGQDIHTRKADGRHSHFQVGVVADDPGSFYDRIPRKQRKRTLVDELLANAEYMKYASKQRRQYSLLQKEKWEKKLAIRRKQKQQQQKSAKRAGKTKTVKIAES
ncbi:unnamed protein product [Schistocephalus solidus]|uniref:Fcf2 domain-containing protein n=1 Tax=Schistocephalus solidus TaxID=70667 RepID=A0A183S771_SCHSO|nr:unnamed protein product [Schistocephalus solidus]